MWDVEEIQDDSRLPDVLRYGLVEYWFALQELEESTPVIWG